MSQNLDHNLIFLHLPKTGGSTLHAYLERQYNLENTFTIKVVNKNELNTQEFISLNDSERKKIKLLKGHMNFGLHKYLYGESKYMTFLRKPEERIISFYYYALNSKNHRLNKTLINEQISLVDFISQLNDKDTNNGQIRYISGIDDTEQNMLEKAMENIDKHFSFIGLQEKFDESLLLLSRIYKWGTPYYKTLNKTNKPESSKQLPLDVKTLINDLNRGDNILYDYIEERINNQLKQISNLELEIKKIKLYSKVFTLSKNLKKKIYQLKK
jgi:hypothetical protein